MLMYKSLHNLQILMWWSAPVKNMMHVMEDHIIYISIEIRPAQRSYFMKLTNFRPQAFYRPTSKIQNNWNFEKGFGSML